MSPGNPGDTEVSLEDGAGELVTDGGGLVPLLVESESMSGFKEGDGEGRGEGD